MCRNTMDSIKGSGINKNAWKCRLKCNGKMRRNTVYKIKSLVKNKNAWKCRPK